MKKLLAFIVGFILIIGLVWGMYWLAKTGSYLFFYEDMVQETIREMVKSGALK